MKRIVLPIAVAIAAGAIAVSAALAASPTVKLASRGSLGKIIVNGRGFTAYAFTADSRNKDVCVKRAGCTGIWPPLTTKGKPVAGPGLKRRLLGTIKLNGGRRQVTYAGHPLYRYAFDTPGATDYVGISEFGGKWLALTASGHLVK